MATADIQETGGAVVPAVKERNLYQGRAMSEVLNKVSMELERAKLAGPKGDLEIQAIYGIWARVLASSF